LRFIMLLAAGALVAAGIATIYSVGHPLEAGSINEAAELGGLWHKQLFFALLGAAALVGVNLVGYRFFGSVSYWLYGIALIMLVLLLLDRWLDVPFIPVINNARRWFRIGAGGHFVQLQPSEFFKPAYILSLCWYLRYRSNYRSIKALVWPFVLTLVPMFFILAEPDLGTAVLLLPVLLTMLFLAGAKVKHLLLIILLSVLISPLMWHKLRPYQRTRISSVLLQSGWVRRQAEQKPAIGRMLVGRTFSEKQWKNNWGYHLIRAKFSVASGGLTGYGYRNGPFIKYNFLPERHNDFIFAVMAHQWGFLGALVVLGLYAVIIICGMEIMSYNTDPFGRLLAAGIVVMFAVEVLVNVSMTLGLMPITGLTLPLVSYGGSSLLVNMISVGLLNNIGRSRPFSVAART